MKAWVHGSTWISDPGPMGAGIVFDDGKDWCVALSGWGTSELATWNALTLCVEYFATEYENQKRLTVFCNEPEVVKQATKRLRVRRRDLAPLEEEFWYLRKIVRKMKLKVHIRLGEVNHAAAISNAAAEIAGDTLGVESPGAGRPEGEGPRRLGPGDLGIPDR